MGNPGYFTSETPPVSTLFDLTTHQPVAFTADARTGHLSVGQRTFADDLLTNLAITTFGSAPSCRLTIVRPSSIGVAALRRNEQAVHDLLHEYPVRPQLVEVGISPNAAAVWSTYVWQRAQYYQALADAIEPVSRTLGDGRQNWVVGPVSWSEKPRASSTLEQLRRLVITVEITVHESSSTLQGALS